MANRLRLGLHAYVKALEKQYRGMSEQRERLDVAWARARDTYSGDGADAFEEIYLRSMNMLTAYMEAVERILPRLKSGLESLDRYELKPRSEL